MPKKTTITILIILAFVAIGVISAMFSSRQLQAPQAKEAISEEAASVLIPSQIIVAKGISFGLIALASAAIGAGVAFIINNLAKNR